MAVSAPSAILQSHPTQGLSEDHLYVKLLRNTSKRDALIDTCHLPLNTANFRTDFLKNKKDQQILLACELPFQDPHFRNRKLFEIQHSDCRICWNENRKRKESPEMAKR